MSNVLIEKLLKLPEFEVTDLKQNEYDMGIYVQTRNRPNYCPVCGSTDPPLVIYKSRQQIVRDLSIHGQRVGLFINRRYYQCQECSGRFSEPLDCIDGKNRMTVRLRDYIAQQAKFSPFSTIENDLKISHTTIRKIFLEEVEKLPSLKNMCTPRILGIDEICLVNDSNYKRKQPWAVIANGEERTVMEMLKDRSKPAIIQALNSLQNPSNVEVVTMDMWAGYRNAVYETLPNAIVVIDKFHVLKMFTELLDNMRRKYSHYGPSELKRNRSIFLMREDKLSPYALELRQQWFDKYPALETACRLTENFYKIYDSKTRLEAEALYHAWQRTIPRDSDFNGFRMMTSTIRRCETEIFNYFDAPNTNAFVEGLNSLIRSIALQGRGYEFEVLRGKVLFTAGRKYVYATPPVDYRTIQKMNRFSSGIDKFMDCGIPFNKIVDALNHGCYEL
mgnify:CR=1 FL=1